MKRNIIVKVQTPFGERHLTFHPVTIDREDENLCETKCPYGGNGSGLCDKMRDPRDPENPNSYFMVFCQEINVKSDLATPDKEIDMNSYVPAPMTVEENLMDVCDINREIIKRNPYVKLDKVIDSVCSGWCADYCADHSKCTSKNLSCIIPNLLKAYEDEKKEAEELEALREEAINVMLEKKDQEDEKEMKEAENKNNG